MYPIDSVFSFPEVARLNFLHSAFHSFGCAYICLWSYSSSSNRLLFLDGFYHVPNKHNQASSSLTRVDQRLFDRYRGLEFDVATDDRVPGLAFRNRHSYLELQQPDLLRLAWTDIQRQFFQEARIKTAVFMGCSDGEIELGFSAISQGDDIETDLRNLFPEEFSRHSHPTNRPAIMERESEHDAITKAILHVISSPSSNSTSQYHHQQNIAYASVVHPEGVSAFKRYRPDLAIRPNNNMRSNLGRQSLLKRSFELSRRLNFMRMRERFQASRPTPTTTQLLHMISERRRREKLNQNFQALRALLPPGTKKDKASILTTAKETLRSLMAETETATKRNQQLLEVQLQKAASDETNERLSVGVSPVPGSSSSEERIMDLQVTVRSGTSSQVDISIRLLEFLKEVQNVSLISMGANTHMAQGASTYELTLRLKIEESEWDEAAFQEAVRRVVAGLAL